MSKMSAVNLPAMRFSKIPGICLVLVMLASLLPMASVSASAQPGRAQPILLELAARQPDAAVGVIVQKGVRDTSVEELVARLGGTVTKDLHIINAFAATVPARAVPELARAAGVRWISLDAPTVGSQAGSTAVFTTWATEEGKSTVSLVADFKDIPIAAGNLIWFTGMVKVTATGSAPATITFDNSTIQFAAAGESYTLTVPAATLTFDPAATQATTGFDAVSGRWVTRAPFSLMGDEVFLTGLAFPVPIPLPGKINPVVWSGRFVADQPGVTIDSWKWAAAVYSTLSTDYNTLGVKPCKDGKASQYLNGDKAGTPENFKAAVVAGARGSGGTNYTGDYTSGLTVLPLVPFADQAAMMDSALGPNETFGYGAAARASFAGFAAEVTPGHAITRVEAALRAYAPASLGPAEDLKLTPYVNGVPGRSVTLNHHAFDPYTGPATAGTIYVDITNSRSWQWADFDNGLELLIDQSMVKNRLPIYYDAIGLRVTSAPGTDQTGVVTPTNLPKEAIDTGRLQNVYNFAVRATDVWNEAPAYLQGQGVTVAVVDSGAVKNKDLGGRLIAQINFNAGYHDSNDRYGHGTFVATIIGGDGKHSRGAYIGIAPKTNIINVRISDDQGMATESDVVAGLQWVYEHKARYNIRVVNLSLNSSVAQSYHTSPMDAAVEMLWFNGIVVVVSAGNNGSAQLYPPANDPRVITVGATDDQGTATIADDTIAPFSAYGTTENGAVKPELVAPGKNIVALLGDNRRLTIGQEHPANSVNDHYFRMSGTSMAAPMVSGAVALLLQDEPDLTPDQVKYRLMATANKEWPGYDPARGGAGYLDVYAAVHGTTTEVANADYPPSELLRPAIAAAFSTVNWNSVNWNSVNWNSVNWNSVNWNSVNWNSVNWNSVNWNSVNWNSVNWNSDYWGN